MFKNSHREKHSSKSSAPILQEHISNYSTYEIQQLNYSLQIFLKISCFEFAREKCHPRGTSFKVITDIIPDRPSFHNESNNKGFLARQIYLKVQSREILQLSLPRCQACMLFSILEKLNCCIEQALQLYHFCEG